MSIVEKKKLEEGLEHVKQAEKHLKTSPLKLKFNPDWDPAGDEFSRAATCFKVPYLLLQGYHYGDKPFLMTSNVSVILFCEGWKELRGVQEVPPEGC